MSILVAYLQAGTARPKGIAERIGQVFRASGQTTDVRSVSEVDDASGYDAFVIGSATYAMLRDWSEIEEWAIAIAAELAEIGRQTDDPQQ